MNIGSINHQLSTMNQHRHLEDAAAALEVSLSPEEIALLEEPYVPHAIAGFN